MPFYNKALMKNKSQKWKCISHCGACCRLAPEERPEALEVLSEEETTQYLSMVDSDGWCRFYNKSTKVCSIYQTRPNFCNVKYILKLFSRNSLTQDAFLIRSCKQQIRSVYGGRSSIIKRFSRAIKRSPNSN